MSLKYKMVGTCERRKNDGMCSIKVTVVEGILEKQCLSDKYMCFCCFKKEKDQRPKYNIFSKQTAVFNCQKSYIYVLMSLYVG
jgi:hypothetical protein